MLGAWNEMNWIPLMGKTLTWAESTGGDEKEEDGRSWSQRFIPENLFSWDTSFHAQQILSCSQTLRLSLCCLGIKEGLPGHQLAGQTPSKHKQVLSGHLKLSKVAVFLLKPVLKVEQTLKCFAY